MFGKISLLPTKELSVYGTLIADSFTSVDSQSSNYGGAKYSVLEDSTTAYIKYFFDNNNDPAYYTEFELNSYLRLYVNKPLLVETQGTVNLTENTWLEYVINDLNKPAIEPVVNFTIPANYVGWLAPINLGDLLKAFDKREDFLISLAITINSADYTKTFTKEGTVGLTPRLYYSYLYRPSKPGVNRLWGNVIAGKDASSRYIGSIEIDSNKYKEYFNGEISLPLKASNDNFIGSISPIPTAPPQVFIGEIKSLTAVMHNNFEATVKAVGHRKVLFEGQITPIIQLSNYFNSKVVIKKELKTVEFYGCVIALKTGVVSVAGGITTLRIDGFDKFLSSITPSIEDIDKFIGEMVVPPELGEDKFEGNINPVASNLAEFEGIMDSIEQFSKDDFQGEITPKGEKESQFGGGVDTLKNYTFSTFEGRINPLEHLEDGLVGCLEASKVEEADKFYGTVSIIPKLKELLGIVTVAVSDVSKVNGEIINASIDGTDKFYSSMFVPDKLLSKFLGTIEVLGAGLSEFTGELILSELRNTDKLEGSITTLPKGIGNFYGEYTSPKGVAQLYGETLVKEHRHESFNSEIKSLKNEEAAEFYGEITIKAHRHESFYGEVSVIAIKKSRGYVFIM
jgi:hypothetical protein